MKTYKVVLLTVIVCAVLSVSAQAGDHRGQGGSQDASAPASVSAPAPASARSVSGFGSGSGGIRFGGGRMIAPSQRFSTFGSRSTQRALGPYYIRSNGAAALNQRRITTLPGTPGRSNGFARSENSRARNFGTLSNNKSVGSIGNGNRGRVGGNNHVFARRSADWQRNWDRRRDHWWHGHRCRFVNGYWFIFDLGFSPWYSYPYYASYYYEPDPYAYDSGDYEDGDVTYGGKDVYDSSGQGGESPVAAAQERLAQEGYYRGQIDGIFGPETRRAIMRYQSNKGLGPTGRLSAETLESLGLR